MRATNRVLTRLMMGLAFSAALASATWAAELAGNGPFADFSSGQQSDASGPAYSQTFTAPKDAVLESIRWWGFHGVNSLGSAFDNFVVKLDGVVQTGVLSITSTSAFFDEFTLDVLDAALTASTFTITNDSGDVEWFWQSAPAVGNPASPSADEVAFSLIGHIEHLTVPEPATSTVALIALAGMMVARRRPSARGTNLSTNSFQ